MPATSGDITHVKTFVHTAAQLSTIETANLSNGDLALVHKPTRYYSLDKISLLPANGTTVLYTKNARQPNRPTARSVSSPTTTPGRWILLDLLQSIFVQIATVTGSASTNSPRPDYVDLLSLFLPEGSFLVRATVAATFLTSLQNGFGNAFFRFTTDEDPNVSLGQGEFGVTSAALPGPPFDPPIPASGSGSLRVDAPAGGTNVHLQWAVNEFLAPSTFVSIVSEPNNGQHGTLTAERIAV